MARIVPGRKYTFAQIREMQKDPELAALKLEGYVLRQDMDGTVQFVHHTQASAGFRGSEHSLKQYKAPPGTVEAMKAENPPIVRRTPQERVDSMMLKLITTAKKNGYVPTGEDAEVKEIVAQAWRDGRSNITAETVRQVAAIALAKAEKANAMDDQHNVVRKHHG